MNITALESAILSPALKTTLRHWNAARDVRRMPAWRDIKPSAIAQHLPIIWAYKYDAASDVFTGRLAGERIVSLLGSIRGRNLAEYCPADKYPTVFARFKRVVCEPAFNHGQGLIFQHVQHFGSGERIMMPLADDGEHADGILGATEYRLSNVQLSSELLAAGEAEAWYTLD